MSDSSLANLIVSLVGNPDLLLAAFEKVAAAGEAMAASVAESTAAVEAAVGRMGAAVEEASSATAAAMAEQEAATTRTAEATVAADTEVIASVEETTAVIKTSSEQVIAVNEEMSAAQKAAIAELNAQYAALGLKAGASAEEIAAANAKIEESWAKTSAAVGASIRENEAAMDHLAAQNQLAAAEIEAADAKAAAATEGMAARIDTASSAATRVLSGWRLVFAGLAAGVAYESIKMAADFQQASERLVTSAGEDQRALDDIIRPKMIDMAGELGVSMQKLATDMYPIESSGQRGQAALNLLALAEKGAAAEGADGTKVAEALTTAMHDYYPKATSAADATKYGAEVMSAFLGATSQGKMTFDELAGAMSRLLPVAAKFNIGIADALGVLASMTSHGISAEQAAMNEAHAIDKLAGQGTQSMRTWAKVVGTSMDEINSSMEHSGLAKTLEMIDDKIKNHLGPDGVKAITSIRDAVKGSDNIVQQTTNSLLAGEMTVGDYRNAVKGMTEAEKARVQPVLALIDAQQQMNGKQVTGADIVSNYGALWKNVTGDLTTAKVATMTVGENTDYTNESIQRIQDGMKNGKAITEAWAHVQENFNQKLSEAGESLAGIGMQIGNALLPYVSAALDVFKDFAHWLSENHTVAKGLAIVIGGVLTIALGALAVKMTAAILKPTLSLGKAALRFERYITDRIVQWQCGENAAEEAATVEETAQDRMVSAMERAAASMEASAERLAQTLQLPADAAEEASSRIAVSSERDIAAEDAKAASLAELVARVERLKEQEAEAVQVTNDKMAASEEATAEKFRAGGALIDEGLAAGIEEGLHGPIDAVSELNKELELRFREDWEIESPSRKTHLFGNNLDQGLAAGIEEGAAAVVEAATVTAEKVVAAFDKVVPEGAVAGEKLDESLAAGIREGEAAAVASGREVAAAVVAAVDAETALVKPVVVRTVAEPGAAGAAAAEGEGATAAGAAGAGAAAAGKKRGIGGKLMAGAGTVFGVAMGAQIADQMLPANTDAQNQAGQHPFSSPAAYTDHARSELAGIAGAVNDPGAALADAKKQFDDFPAQFQKSPFMNFMRGLSKTLSDLWAGVKRGMSTQVDIFLGPLKAAWNGVSGWWNGTVVPWFHSIPQKIRGAVGDAKTWLSNVGHDIIDGLKRGAENWYNANVAPWFSPMQKRIQAFFKDPVGTLQKIGQDLIDGLKRGALNWYNANIAPWFGAMPKALQDFFKDPLGTLRRIGEQIITGLKNGALSWWNANVQPWVTSLTSLIQSFIHDPLGTLRHIGEQIINGFLDGLKSAWQGVVSFVSGLGPWIAAHKGPIEVDRVLLQPHGQAIMSGLIDGLHSQMPHLDAQLAAITGRVQAVGGDGAALQVAPAYSRGGPGGGSSADAAGGVTVHVHVAGSVLAEKDLVDTVQKGLLQRGIRNSGSGITYGFGTGR